MRKMLHLAPLLLLSGLLVAGAALAAEEWDHRGMQSHHQAVDRVEPKLAPGEKRIGRITIGAPAPASAAVPPTLSTATQRQWEQRGSFVGPSAPSDGPSPRITAGRHENTPGGGVHTTSSR